jgi:hypothetical protein
MTTKAPARRKRSPGFTKGFRAATHTDNLRHRLGGAAGRALVRKINRARARRGKPPIPVKGTWTGAAPARRQGGSRRPPGRAATRQPFTGRHVTAAHGRARSTAPKVTKVPAKSKARRQAKVSTPLTDSDLDRLVAALRRAEKERGQSSKRVAKKPSVPTSGGQPIVKYTANGTPVTRSNLPLPPTAWEVWEDWRAKQAAQVAPTSSTATPPNGRTGTMGNFDQLTEAPTSDAEHLSNVSDLSSGVQEMADKLAEYISMCQTKGFDQEALDSLQRAAEMLGEAATELQNASSDFENHYAGVREHAAAGKTVVGDDAPVDFWTGDGR